MAVREESVVWLLPRTVIADITHFPAGLKVQTRVKCTVNNDPARDSWQLQKLAPFHLPVMKTLCKQELSVADVIDHSSIAMLLEG